MSDPTLLLGAAAVRTFFRVWLKDNAAAQEAACSLSDLIEGRISDTRQRREVRRLFEKLEERVADQVLTFLECEYRDVPTNEREAAIHAVTLTLDNARLSVPDILATDLNPLYLERAVRRSSKVTTRDLSPVNSRGFGLVRRV